MLPKALTTCLRVSAKGMEIDVNDQLEAAIDDLVDGFLFGQPRVSVEPALASYAI